MGLLVFMTQFLKGEKLLKKKTFENILMRGDTDYSDERYCDVIEMFLKEYTDGTVRKKAEGPRTTIIHRREDPTSERTYVQGFMQLLRHPLKIPLLPPVWKIYHSMILTTLMNGQRHLMKNFNLILHP